MRTLVDRWSLSACAFLGIIKLLQVLRGLGLRPREDGFRRATRALFHTPEAHACMAVFGLDVSRQPVSQQPLADEPCDRPSCPSPHAALIARLRSVLASRPEIRRRLSWGRIEVRIVERDLLDLVEVGYDDDGLLTTVVPFLAPSEDSYAPDVLDLVGRELVEAYNQTLHHPARRRPFDLRHTLLRHVNAHPGLAPARRGEAARLADRLFNAVWITVETVRPPGPGEEPADFLRRRLEPPDVGRNLGTGGGGFVITVRHHPDLAAVDLWFEFHHALADGAPCAEWFAELEREWGVRAPLTLPAPEAPHGPRPRVRCSVAGSRESWLTWDHLDLGPLLTARDEIQAHLDQQARGDRVSTLGLLLWRLLRSSVFRDLKFSIAVDVPSTPNRERTLGIAAIRPAVFLDDHAPDQGFAQFNRELSRRIRDTRERRSDTYELVESIALLPAPLYPVALALLGKGIRECLGTIGISSLRGTSVVIPAQSDIHTDGFLGYGRFDIPTAQGDRAGIVAAKGPPELIDAYMEAVRLAVEGP